MYVRIVDEWSFTDNSDDRPELVASAASANLGPLVDRYIPCGNWQLGSDKRAKVRCSGTRGTAGLVNTMAQLSAPVRPTAARCRASTSTRGAGMVNWVDGVRLGSASRSAQAGWLG